MELDQLRHFLAVVQWESFSKAAEEIGLSQSALSRSILRLEEQIGRQLLDRQSRKVVPTDAGRILETRARELVGRIEDVQAELSDDGQHGTIRIGAIPTIAPYFLPAYLRKFQNELPEAKVIVQEETTSQLIRKVHDGEVDVAIAALPIDSKYLQIEELFEEELQLVVSIHDPLAKKQTLRWSDLEQRPFILMGEAHCLTTNVVSFCHQKNIFPLSIERTSQLAMLQELVSLQHGVSLIPAMAANLDTNPERTYRTIIGTKPTRTVVSVTNPYRYQSKLLNSFLEAVRVRETTSKTTHKRKKQ